VEDVSEKQEELTALEAKKQNLDLDLKEKKRQLGILNRESAGKEGSQREKVFILKSYFSCMSCKVLLKCFYF